MERRVNTSWFKTQIESQNITHRRVASALGLHPSAVTLILGGKRRLRLEEATKLAKLFAVPIEDVLSNAGIDVAEVSSESTVPIKGWIDADLSVRWELPRGPKRAPYPFSGGRGINALRFITTGSRFDAMDGGLIYYRGTTGVDSGAIGRLCVVEILGDRNLTALRVVKQGYRAGQYNLYTMGGELAEDGARLKYAAPVAWMKL